MKGVTRFDMLKPPRRGMALVYMSVAIVVVSAFASLGVDFARVELAKTELQRAADAAARYAVNGLPTPGQVQNNAVAVAAQNLVDGSSLALDATNDVEF